MLETVALVGQPDDPTGMMYDAELRRRGIKVLWFDLGTVMKTITYPQVGTLRAYADEDPYAINVETQGVELMQDAPIREAKAALIVSVEFSGYEPLVTRVLAAAGIVQANSPDSVESARNKWLSHVKLRDAGIAVPNALLANSRTTAAGDAEKLGFPVVVKELTSTQGDGVRLAGTSDELQKVLSTLHIADQPLMIEHYIECDATDKRILVLDGKVIAAVERHAPPGDFRSNLALGGKAKKCEITDAEIEISLAITKTLGLTLAGLDIASVSRVLEGREYLGQGAVFCFEANASPGLRGISSTNGVDLSVNVIDLLESRCS